MKKIISFTKYRLFWPIICGAIVFLLLFAASVAWAGSQYKAQHFGDSKIDELVFYFNNGLAGGRSDGINDAILTVLQWAIIPTILFVLPLVVPWRRLGNWLTGRPKLQRLKKIHWKTVTVRWRHRLAYAFAIFVWGMWGLLSSFGVPQYVQALSQSSRLFEDNYVDPSTADIKFPAKKRNLIHIYMESMENTPASKVNGGRSDESIIPELEELALDKNNISFSHQPSGLGGMLPATGTTWTVAGITAQTAGIPLKDGHFGKNRNEMGAFNQFIPGAYTSGQILQKAGYNQSFLMGSEANFGGRDKLLTQHGGFTIKDYLYAKQNGQIAEDYKVWWGYEDKKLFQFAKEEATRLAQSDKPFNLQLLTVDTHFTDGYLDETCEQKYAAKYDNVHACSSKQVAAFVKWLREQPFADNTTIVLTGDHLGMQTSYYDEKIAGAPYQRTVYNAIINPAVRTDRTHNRQFTSFDMYPTILASIGAEIPGDQLGLGVNLFSNQQTLIERMGGLEALNAELAKRSTFYERKIMIGGGR